MREMTDIYYDDMNIDIDNSNKKLPKIDFSYYLKLISHKGNTLINKTHKIVAVYCNI